MDDILEREEFEDDEESTEDDDEDSEYDDKFEDYYEKKHQIGYFGAGFFYECIGKEIRNRFAVKVYEFWNADDLETVRDEMRICTMLDHKNIMTLIQAFEGRKLCHLVFDMMAGGDMFDDMGRRTVYTEYDASRRMRQVFEGVFYLHDHKIFHRNLKPECLRLTNKSADAVVKISGFDSARYCRDKIKQLSSRLSLPYCAPDLFDPDGYWFGADMWSCGVILFLAFFGELPFKGVDEDEVIDRIVAGKYVFPKDCKPVCEEAEELLHELLDMDPEVRGTAREALLNDFIKYPDVFARTAHRAKAIENIKAFNQTRKARRTEAIRQHKRSESNPLAKSSSTVAIENYRSMSDEAKLARTARRAGTDVDIPVKSPEATAQEIQQAEASLSPTEQETPSLT